MGCGNQGIIYILIITWHHENKQNKTKQQQKIKRKKLNIYMVANKSSDIHSRLFIIG